MKTFARKVLLLIPVCIVLGGCSRDSSKTSEPARPAANQAQNGTPPKNGPSVKELKLLPVDEAPQDPSLVAFRQELIEAVNRKDHQFIRSILDPKIVVSFGGSGGVDQFFEFWKPERPDSQLWEELSTILSMGGSFEPSQGEPSFWAPYVFSTWDRLENQLTDADDVFEYSAIVAENVELKANPQRDAAVVSMLTYDVVKVDGENSIRESGKDKFAWVKVTTTDGKTGFVEGQNIRSPVDYRACFQKRDNLWRMTVLVAGD